MSRGNSKKKVDDGFIARFIEVCGSHRVTDVQQLLNISAQAAHNYLGGRVPEAGILLEIADRTPYSIHWLLTGIGRKFVENNISDEVSRLPQEMQVEIARIVRHELNERLGPQNLAAKRFKILQPERELSEKRLGENPQNQSGETS